MPRKNKTHKKRKAKVKTNKRKNVAGQNINRYNCGQDHVIGINDAACDECVEQKVAAWREANRGRPASDDVGGIQDPYPLPPRPVNKIRDFYNECARESAARNQRQLAPDGRNYNGWKKPLEELPNPDAAIQPGEGIDIRDFPDPPVIQDNADDLADLERRLARLRQDLDDDDDDDDDIDLRRIAPLPRVRRENFLRDLQQLGNVGMGDILEIAAQHGLNSDEANQILEEEEEHAEEQEEEQAGKKSKKSKSKKSKSKKSKSKKSKHKSKKSKHKSNKNKRK